MKKNALKTSPFLAAILLAALPFVFSGCTGPEEPAPAGAPAPPLDPPLDPAEEKAAENAEIESRKAGVDVPPVAGIASGDVKNVRQYVDRVTEANERNSEKARSGDWNYSRPAVGGDDSRY